MVINQDLDKCEFSTEADGHKAVAKFRIYDGCLDVRHVYVPEEIGGRGIAAALVKAVYDYATEQKLECVATCSYALAWLKRHPDYHGRSSTDYVEGACAI